MSAAVHERPVTTDDQRVPGRERSWIDAALRDWGGWLWERRHFEGYPTSDNVSAFISGRGGGTAGHRVLCRDMPPWILFAHVIWLMLPEELAIVVWAEFVPGVDDTGHLFSRDEKLARLELTDAAYRKRLSRARERIWIWSTTPAAKLWMRSTRRS
jgi:hypothetical protein